MRCYARCASRRREAWFCFRRPLRAMDHTATMLSGARISLSKSDWRQPRRNELFRLEMTDRRRPEGTFPRQIAYIRRLEHERPPDRLLGVQSAPRRSELNGGRGETVIGPKRQMHHRFGNG